MVNKKSRNFNGMNYRQVQCSNSKNRSQLDREQHNWLKNNNYKNIGWNNVIELYQKIEEFLDRNHWKEFTLEELFLEADRIGNKYLSRQEIENFNQKLTKEVTKIAEKIELQFPDTEIEIINYSKKNKRRL